LISALYSPTKAATLSWTYVLGDNAGQIVADGSGGVAVVSGGRIIWLDANGNEIFVKQYEVTVAIVGVTEHNLVYETNYTRFYDVDRHGHETFVNDIFRVSSEATSSYTDKFGYFGQKLTDAGMVIARYDFKK
jgi:hypothetical protein